LMTSLSLVGCGGYFFGSGGKGDEDDSRNRRPSPDDPGTQRDPLSLTAAMQTFASCGEAEQYLEDEMVKRMARDIDQSIKWLRQRDEYDRTSNKSDAFQSEADDMASAGSADSDSGPDDYTT